jgi:hypothetical protein
MVEVALFPMLFILTKITYNHRFTLWMVDVVLMVARPRAASERTNSGVLLLGCVAPRLP